MPVELRGLQQLRKGHPGFGERSDAAIGQHVRPRSQVHISPTCSDESPLPSAETNSASEREYSTDSSASDGTSTREVTERDIGVEVCMPSPHACMKVYRSSQEYEEDIQNQQDKDNFLHEEIYTPSMLGPTWPYRILRERPPPKIPLPKCPSTKPTQTIRTKNVGKKRAKWTDENLVHAIACYDARYKLGECCKTFNIPKSSLRDHLSGRTTSRKIGAKTVLTKQEEGLIIEYMDEMVEIGHPLTPQMLKLKVGEICQGRLTPFKDGIPGDTSLSKGTLTLQ